VHVNFHGGGYVFGHPEQDDPLCRYLAAAAKVVVVNVDYLLAPEHPFPHAVEECFDIVRWVAVHGREQGWDGSRLSVGGQSAGGGLAAAVARQARDSADPRIAIQVLHYPPLDLVTDAATKPSRTKRPMISPWLAELFNTAYIPDPAHRSDPLASPAYGNNGDNLEGIAPALVITPELDRLHDEGAHYANRLQASGALVGQIDVPGADHAYNRLGGDIGTVKEIYDAIASAIAKAHGNGTGRDSARR
jgi:acetyl esterase